MQYWFVCAAMLLAILCSLCTAHATEEGDAILGQWLTADGKSHLEFALKRGKYVATVVWLKEPNFPEGDPEAGQPRHDRENPKKELQSRPCLGMNVVINFVYAGKKKYTGGTVYNPETGKTYRAKMTLKGKKLRVRGFIGTPLLGRTTTWTRCKATDKEDAEEAPVEEKAKRKMGFYPIKKLVRGDSDGVESHPTDAEIES